MECRICYAPDAPSARLLQPCACTGTHAHICKTCLCTWVNVRTQQQQVSTNATTCELCLQPFVLPHTVRTKWGRGWGWTVLHDVVLVCGICATFAVIAYAYVGGETVKCVACVVVSAALLLLYATSVWVLREQYVTSELY